MRISDLSSDVCSSDLHIIDIVRRFPMADVAPQGFVSALRPLQPRLYSLASSLAAAPDEAHLTLAPVRYDLHGEARCGVASGLLADRAGPDPVLPVYTDRKSVRWGKSGSGGVGIGGTR